MLGKAKAMPVTFKVMGVKNHLIIRIKIRKFRIKVQINKQRNNHLNKNPKNHRNSKLNANEKWNRAKNLCSPINHLIIHMINIREHIAKNLKTFISHKLNESPEGKPRLPNNI